MAFLKFFNAIHELLRKYYQNSANVSQNNKPNIQGHLSPKTKTEIMSKWYTVPGTATMVQKRHHIILERKKKKKRIDSITNKWTEKKKKLPSAITYAPFSRRISIALISSL